MLNSHTMLEKLPGASKNSEKQEFFPRLHVGYIPTYIDDSKFRELFAMCGELRYCRLYTDSKYNYHIGKVQYKSIEATNEAIKRYHRKPPYNLRVTFDTYFGGSAKKQSISSRSDISEAVSHVIKTPLLPDPDCSSIKSQQQNIGNLGIDSKRFSNSQLVYESPDNCGKQSSRSSTKSSSAKSEGTSEKGISVCTKIDKYENTPRHLSPNCGHLTTMSYQSTGSSNSLSMSTNSSIETVDFPSHLVKVYISYIINPHHFFVRLTKDDSFEGDLQSLEASKTIGAPTVDEIVAAKSTEAKKWQRARILKVNNTNSGYLVHYVDYGYEENVNSSEIRQLPPAIKNIPLQALPCRLVDVQPSDKEWSVAESKTFSSLVNNQDLLAKRVKMEDNTYSIYLFDSEHIDIGDLLSSPIFGSSLDNWDFTSDILFYITYLINGSSHFWVANESNGILNKMCVKLQDRCEADDSNNKYRFEEGSIVAARGSTGECYWYRAYVLKVLPEGYLVQYLDFGNVEEVTELKHLPKDFYAYPPLAVLLQVISDSGTDFIFKVDDLVVMKLKICVSEHFKCITLKNNDTYLYVSTSVWMHINQHLQKKERRVENGSCSLQSCSTGTSSCNSLGSSSKSSESVTSSIPSLPILKLPEIGETIDIIPVLCCPEGIYVQICTEETRQISVKLGKFCGTNEKKLAAIPKINQILYGQSLADDNWYRCKVTKINSAGMVDIQYIDYGNREDLPLDRLTKIPNEYAIFPPLSICVHAPDIRPDMHQAVTEIFESENLWKMKICKKNVSPVEVQILTSNGDLLKDLVIESTINRNALNHVDVKSESRSLTPSVKQNSDKCDGLKSEVKDEVVEIITSVEEAKYAKLPVGQTVNVRIVTVSSPHHIYCWFGDFDEIMDKLDALTEEITNVLSKERPDTYCPAVEELCLAKFDDDQWYRALCISSNRVSCQVVFVDYGNEAEIKSSNLRRMRKEFLKYEIQGIACHFKANLDQFDFTKCEALTDLLAEKFFEVKVVDNEGAHTRIQIPSIEPELKALGIKF